MGLNHVFICQLWYLKCCIMYVYSFVLFTLMFYLDFFVNIFIVL